MSQVDIPKLVASTFNYATEVKDNAIRKAPLLEFLKNKGKVLVGDGAKIQLSIIKNFSNQGGSFQPGDSVNLSQDRPFAYSLYEWKHIFEPIVFYDGDVALNSGKPKIYDSLRALKTRAENSMANNIQVMAYSDGTGNGGKDMLGLSALVSETPAVGILGGIDAAENEFWRNQYDTVASFANDGMDAMEDMFVRLQHVNSRPEAIFTGIKGWKGLKKFGRDKFEYPNPKDMINLNVPTVMYNGIPVYYDSYCPDDDMYFVNSEDLMFYVHPDFNFKFNNKVLESMTQIGMCAIFGRLQCNLVTDKRNGLGRLKINAL